MLRREKSVKIVKGRISVQVKTKEKIYLLDNVKSSPEKLNRNNPYLNFEKKVENKNHYKISPYFYKRKLGGLKIKYSIQQDKSKYKSLKIHEIH